MHAQSLPSWTEPCPETYLSLCYLQQGSLKISLVRLISLQQCPDYTITPIVSLQETNSEEPGTKGVPLAAACAAVPLHRLLRCAHLWLQRHAALVLQLPGGQRDCLHQPAVDAG